MGWCLGFGRTGDEIASWIGLDDAGRLAIWNELPERLDRLAVRARLLPWTRDELKRWIVGTFTDRKGTWVTGVPGALAEFPVRLERSIEVEVNDAAIEAQATDAHLRLTLHDKLRAFAFAGAGPIVLALPRNRATLSRVQGFTPLGVDRDAVDSRHRTHELFDLGLNRQCCRFLIRASSAGFADAMRQHASMKRPAVWDWMKAFNKSCACRRWSLRYTSPSNWTTRALRCSRGFLCPENSRRKGRILIFSRRSSSLTAICPRASPYLPSRPQLPCITPWSTTKRTLASAELRVVSSQLKNESIGSAIPSPRPENNRQPRQAASISRRRSSSRPM